MNLGLAPRLGFLAFAFVAACGNGSGTAQPSDEGGSSGGSSSGGSGGVGVGGSGAASSSSGGGGGTPGNSGGSKALWATSTVTSLAFTQRRPRRRQLPRALRTSISRPSRSLGTTRSDLKPPRCNSTLGAPTGRTPTWPAPRSSRDSLRARSEPRKSLSPNTCAKQDRSGENAEQGRYSAADAVNCVSLAGRLPSSFVERACESARLRPRA
jgi:hypothetical protein